MNNQEKKFNRKRFILLNIIFPIFLGSILYYLIAPEVFFVKEIDKLLHIENHNAIRINSGLMQLIRNHLFDFIWAYSLTNSLFVVFGYEAKRIKICVIISIVMGIVMEVIQLSDPTWGAFDIWDIITEMIAALLASLMIIKFFYQGGLENEEKRN